MTDKAVSTEDLCVGARSAEAARLEAVIKTLIETKVDSIKKRKSSSLTSSPKSIFNKLRGTSTSTVSSKPPEKTLHFTDESNCDEACCCRQEEDFIALSVPEYDVEDGRKRKRRRRRRRHHRKHIRMAATATAVTVQVDDLKELDEDELSQRARMTIVLTACLLLFMCLLLVGITLRMAPLIDDMVRKENEEFMNSLDEESSPNHDNLTVPAH